MATPRAQEAYEEFYATLGGKPVHHTLATHWARLVELLYAAERLLELSTDPDITNPHVRNLPTEKPTEGVGIVEAPRGTLTHHYITDERGIVKKANLIVGTTNNYAPIAISVRKAAQAVIQKGVVTEGILNRVEMAFRSYDPCFGCATHTLSGQMPLEVRIFDAAGNIKDVLKRGVGAHLPSTAIAAQAARSRTSAVWAVCFPVSMLVDFGAMASYNAARLNGGDKHGKSASTHCRD